MSGKNVLKLKPLFLINSAWKLSMEILGMKTRQTYDAYHFFSNSQRGKRRGSVTEDDIVMLAAKLSLKKELDILLEQGTRHLPVVT